MDLIPEKQYVGISTTNGMGKYQLAFAIPYRTKDDGTPYADVKKRMETVNDWCRSSNKKEIVDNGFQTGFRIVGCVERHKTHNKWFRVEDPRGFELEISCDNLYRLMQSVTIKDGTIIDKCAWADGDALVSEKACKEQEASIKKAEKEKPKTISVKNAPVGSTVELASKANITYLGKMYYFYYDTGKHLWKWAAGKKHVYIQDGKLRVTSEIEITKIVEEPREKIDAQEIVTEMILKNREKAANPIEHCQYCAGPISLLSASKPKDTSMFWKPVDREQFDRIAKTKEVKDYYTSYPFFIEDYYIGSACSLEFESVAWTMRAHKVDLKLMKVYIHSMSSGYSGHDTREARAADVMRRRVKPIVANIAALNYDGEWYPARLEEW